MNEWTDEEVVRIKFDYRDSTKKEVVTSGSDAKALLEAFKEHLDRRLMTLLSGDSIINETYTTETLEVIPLWEILHFTVEDCKGYEFRFSRYGSNFFGVHI